MDIKCERIFLLVTKKDFYSQLPITRTLANSNLALTRTKYRFPVDFFLCSTCTEVKLETIPVSLDSGPNCAYSLIHIYGSKGNVFSLNCTILFRIFPNGPTLCIGRNVLEFMLGPKISLSVDNS